MSQLPLDILLRERADREGVGMDMVVRDLLQSRFLAAIFAGSVKREVVLKGGLSFRTLFASQRHTKDVDLQTDPSVPVARIKALVRTALTEALGTGLLADLRISEPKQTDTVQRWKVGGTLAGGSHVNMTVEVSRRGLPPEAMTSRIEHRSDVPGSPAVLVETYSPGTLAAAKTAALISPSRQAVRDVYDLDLLISMEVSPSAEMIERLGADVIARGLGDLWSKIESLDWNLAKQDLLPSLPKNVAAKLDEAEWDAMRLRVGQAVEGWLMMLPAEQTERIRP